MNVTKTKEVTLSERLYEEYKAAYDSHRTQMKEDREFRDGIQWTKEQENYLKKLRQSPVVVNIVGPIVDQGVALLTSNHPRFSAVGREDSDNKIGKAFAGLLEWVWNISNGNTEAKLVIDDYYTTGSGFWCAYVDPSADFGNGEVFVKSLDPFVVYIDPNSKDKFARDAAHILTRQLYSKEQILRMFPRIDLTYAIESENHSDPASVRFGNNGESDYDGYVDKYHTHYEVIDRYTKISKATHKVLNVITGKEVIIEEEEFNDFLEQTAFMLNTPEGEQYVSDKLGVEQLIMLYQQTGGAFHYEQDPESGQPVQVPGEENENSIPNSTTYIIPVNMSTLIEKGVLLDMSVKVARIRRVVSIGGIEAYNDVMGKLSEYPIVPLFNNFRRKPFCMSDVRKTKGLQQYINKLRSLIIAHASSSTNTKLLIPKGSVNKKELATEWAKAGTGTIEYDPEFGVPIVAGPVPLPNELYKNESDAKANIELIFGIWEMMHGNTAAAPATYKGTLAIDEFGQRRIRSKRDDVEDSLTQLAKVVIELIQSTYTERKEIRLLRPNHEAEQVVINESIYDDLGNVVGLINDVTEGKVDVVVQSGSMLPNNRYAQLEFYSQLYKDGIIDQVEVLKKTEVVDVEGVLNRSSQIAQMQQQLAAMEQQIKMLSGDIQTKDREISHLQKKVELSKFQADLRGYSGDAQKAVQLYQAGLEADRRLQDVKNSIKQPQTK